jgi:hypothetical protein
LALEVGVLLGCHGGSDEVLEPAGFALGIAECFAGQQLDARDTGFAAAAAFDHGLEDFQGVEVVRFHAAAVDGDGFDDFCLGWHFDGWSALGQRDAAAGHERDAELAGLVVHGLGPVPAVREMFVVEDGNEAARALHHGDDLIEKFLAGVHPLAELVGGIIAVLADQEDGIDGERLAAEAEGLVDRGKEGHAEALGSVAGHVAFRELVGVEGDDFDARIDPLAAEQTFAHQVDEEIVGVGAVAEFGEDGGDFGALDLGSEACRGTESRGGASSGEKLTTSETVGCHGSRSIGIFLNRRKQR